jgi:hypothetical protein
MKRLVAALFITLVILGVVTGFLLYQNSEMWNLNSEIQNQLDVQQTRNSELENEILELGTRIDELEKQRNDLQGVIVGYTDIVNITEFTVHGWDPLAGLTIGSHANITIKNNGVNSITDLVLTLECPTVNSSKSWTIEVIHPREEIQIKDYVMWNLGSNPTWVATISKGDKILDTRTTWD